MLSRFKELTRLWRKAWEAANERYFFDQMAQLNIVYGEYLFTQGKTHKALTYYVRALVDAMKYNPMILQKAWQKLRKRILNLLASKKKRTARIYLNRIIEMNSESSFSKQIPEFDNDIASIEMNFVKNMN